MNKDKFYDVIKDYDDSKAYAEKTSGSADKKTGSKTEEKAGINADERMSQSTEDKMFDTQELQKIMNERIILPDNLSDTITQGMKEGMRRSNRRLFYANRKSHIAAAAVAICVLALAAGGTTIAVVRSYVQQRMEEVPKEELTEMVEDIDQTSAEGYTYSRAFTEMEMERLRELRKSYEQGLFPESRLLEIESAEAAEADKICYMASTSTFYLPETEMTDEQLLQYIDFDEKLNFALHNRYEEVYAEEVKEEKEQKLKFQQEMIAAGGITQEEALEIGKTWLNKLYGVTPEGMEENGYFDEANPDMGVERSTYNVNWSIRSDCYYYFTIDPMTGDLISTEYSNAAWLQTQKIGSQDSVKDAAEQMQLLCKNARTILEQIGLKDSFSRIYGVYSLQDTDVVNPRKRICFETEGDVMYIVTYQEQEFSGFEKTSKEKYERTVQESEEYHKMNGGNYTRKVVELE